MDIVRIVCYTTFSRFAWIGGVRWSCARSATTLECSKTIWTTAYLCIITLAGHIATICSRYISIDDR
uniref:Candidate secreted effector n=1 Tax=Meloidogyne incognita TaxID=6306 RepID=A0A914N575_MELIC